MAESFERAGSTDGRGPLSGSVPFDLLQSTLKAFNDTRGGRIVIHWVGADEVPTALCGLRV